MSMTDQVGLVQARPQPGRGDRSDRRGIGEHEPDPRVGMRRVDRQICRPGLEHRQNSPRSPRPTGKTAAPHAAPGPAPRLAKQVRQPVGGLIQLAIGPRTLTAADRHRLWRAGHLRGEQHRNRHQGARWLAQHRPVAPLIQPVTLTGIEQIDRRQPPRRISGHGNKHLLEPVDQRFDAGRVERVGVEFDAKAQFVARRRHHRKRVMVEFAAGELGDGQLVHAQQRAGVDRVVLVDEKGVEQLVVACDAMNLAERQVLVLERVVVDALQLV